MKRRRIILLLTLAATVAAGFVLFWPSGPKDPAYQGKRLSKWIKEAQGTADLVGSLGGSKPLQIQRGEAARKAIQAIQSIGTNALPYLLYELTRPISQWRVSFNRWAEGKISFRFRDEEERIWQAAEGLQILGPDSASALPVLAGYLADPKRGFAAAHAMSGAGELAVPYLLTAITGTNHFTAERALGALGDIAKEHESAVPHLVGFVQHTNAVIRQGAASHLAVVESRTDLTVPALTAALSDPEWAVRHYAANALGGIGPKARAAVPDLLRLMNQPPPTAARAASNAIFHIDPAALPQRRP